MSLGIVIQARMGSRRLPGKVLRTIHHRTLLDHILYRLEKLERQTAVVIATTVRANDDAIKDFCANRQIDCYRGSEENVLKRYHDCAKEFGFSQIVRLTGDNPFTDIEELGRLIDFHLVTGNDFSHSFGQLPIGVGAEIFTFSALEMSIGRATEPHHFEHVDEYMLEHPELFKTGAIEVPESKRQPTLRLTVDTEQDLEVAADVFRLSKSDFVSTEEAIEICSRFV